MVKREQVQRQLSTQRFILWGGLIAYLPFGFIVLTILPREVGIALLAVYGIVWGLNGAAMNMTICPNCGRKMFQRGWLSYIMARKCLHCRWPD